MASNDMNSWGEDPDELLRRRWQQTFAEFDVQSRPSLRRRILSQIATRNRPKPVGWLVMGVLLLLVSAVLTYTVRRSNQPRPPQGSIANIEPAHPNHSQRVSSHQPATQIREATSSQKPELGPGANGSVVIQQPADRKPIASGTKSTLTESSLRRPVRPTNRLRLRTESTQPLADSYRTGWVYAKSLRFQDTHPPVSRATPAESSHRQWAESLVENSSDGSSRPTAEYHVSARPPLSTVSPVVFERLETPTLSARSSSLRALPDQLPANELVIRPADDAANRVRRYKQWFVEAVPLSSFQWMSTSSASTAYLTQVSAPAAFSPSTWGYQINGGVRWQRWQAYLSLGQLRRWAYYTVNENRYRLEPSSTNPYQLVREQHVVAENVAMSLIGGGLSQYRLLAQGRYMIELGSQLVYSPMSGQVLASLRGGAGRRLPISQRFELQAGLVAEYGLTRLMSEQQELIIHPIVVGVNVRIQPKLHSPKK